MDKKPLRDEKGRLLPGQSANPSGRPKTTTAQIQLRELAGKYTEEALKGLYDIAKNERAPAIARVQAWNSLLDRAHGRPAQAVEHSGTVIGSLADALARAFGEEAK